MTIDSKYLPLEFVNDREVVYTVETDSQGDPLQFEVYKDDLLLTLDYHYSLTFGEYNRRVTVLLAAPLTAGSNLRVLRKTPIVNTFAATPNQPFKTEAFEYMLDRATLIQQEIEGHACACPEFPNVPEGVAPPNFVLPTPLPPECQPFDCAAFADWLADSGEGAEHVDISQEITGLATVPATLGSWTVVGSVGTPWNDNWVRPLANDPATPSAVVCEVNDASDPLVIGARNTFGSAYLQRAGGSVAYMVRVSSSLGNGDSGILALGNSEGQIAINGNQLRAFVQGGGVESVDLPADFSYQGPWLYFNFESSERFEFQSGNTWWRFVSITATLHQGGVLLASISGEWQGTSVGGGAFPRPDPEIYILRSSNRLDCADILTGTKEQLADGLIYYQRKFRDYTPPSYCPQE